MVKGLAKRSYGLNVARLAGVPEEIIETAGEISENFEHASKLRANRNCFMNLYKQIQALDEGKVSSEEFSTRAKEILENAELD